MHQGESYSDTISNPNPNHTEVRIRVSFSSTPKLNPKPSYIRLGLEIILARLQPYPIRNPMHIEVRVRVKIRIDINPKP
jgi:hypothetical protein